MERILVLLAFLLPASTSCDSKQPPLLEINNIQIQRSGTHQELLFELSIDSFWEVEASDQIDDMGSFFTIAQGEGVGIIKTGKLELNSGEDYIIRILAYTINREQVAIEYVYIDSW